MTSTAAHRIAEEHNRAVGNLSESMSTLTDPQTREYRALRRDGMPAMRALQTIRLRETYRAALEPFGEWEWPRSIGGAEYGAFAYADLRCDETTTLRVLVGDDDCPTDWGDCEPTDEERDATTSYYVAVQVLENGAEVYHDGIGGVDAMDLPHSSVRDWEDAAGYALTEYLLRGALHYVYVEATERAHWEARGVVTA